MIRSGSLITFNPVNKVILSEQWRSEKIEPDLRMLVIVAGMVYHSLGSSRITINKLLDPSTNSVHYYGVAADVSIMELIDCRIQNKEDARTRRSKKGNWCVDMLNALFTADKEVAIYNLDHIHLQVPTGGFKKGHLTLATWPEFGPDGKYKSPAVPVIATDLRY